jgi:hypothetical protein
MHNIDIRLVIAMTYDLFHMLFGSKAIKLKIMEARSCIMFLMTKLLDFTDLFHMINYAFWPSIVTRYPSLSLDGCLASMTTTKSVLDDSTYIIIHHKNPATQ